MQVQCTEEPALFLSSVFLRRYLCYFFLCVDRRPLETDPLSTVRLVVFVV